ncbi:MAG: cation diffusion facilitator family transporter [Gammaproteobacteria bacterium]|nr:cation diffusion facilitator family transporter [Gammaproteobacteria bacterium]
MQHNHSHTPNSFNFAFSLAVFFNATFVIFQAIYAIKSHSMSLLADAAHNAGDVVGLLLAWLANWLLSLPARKRYSYGFRRTTMFAALTNALLLIASTMFIVFESIQKILHPVAVNSNTIMIVAFIGIIINGSTALLFMRGAHSDLNIKSAFLHLAGDAVISFGVVIAGCLIYFTHANWIDPISGILIVIVILWSTFGLLRDAVNLMLDAVPRHIQFMAVQEYLENLSGVTNVHDLHIWGLSTREVALTAHLVMPGTQLSDETLGNINQTLKKDFQIDHITLQVETGNIAYPCHKKEKC